MRLPCLSSQQLLFCFYFKKQHSLEVRLLSFGCAAEKEQHIGRDREYNVMLIVMYYSVDSKVMGERIVVFRNILSYAEGSYVRYLCLWAASTLSQLRE